MSAFRRQNRKSPIIICAICTLLVAVFYLFQYGHQKAPLYKGELYFEDSMLSKGRKAPCDPRLIFLAIDDNSTSVSQIDPAVIQATPALQLMQKGWPWPHAVYPMILDRLFDSGAKVVAMDLLFPTPRDGDEAFRAALDKYRDRVVLGSNFTKLEREGTSTDTYVVPAPNLIPQTSPQDDRIGFVNYWGDGVVRRASYLRTMTSIFGDDPVAGEEVFESLPARVLEKSGNGNLIPKDEFNRVRFAGPPGTFEPHSLCDIFVPASWNSPEFDGGKVFQGKIVVIGALGQIYHDYVKTPFEPFDMTGPEMHLNAINDSLTNSFLHEIPPAGQYLLIACAGIVAWALCVLIRAPLWRLIVFLVVAGAWLLVAQVLYNYASLVLFTFPPLVALGSSGICCLSWDFFQEQTE